MIVAVFDRDDGNARLHDDGQVDVNGRASVHWTRYVRLLAARRQTMGISEIAERILREAGYKVRWKR